MAARVSADMGSAKWPSACCAAQFYWVVMYSGLGLVKPEAARERSLAEELRQLGRGVAKGRALRRAAELLHQREQAQLRRRALPYAVAGRPVVQSALVRRLVREAEIVACGPAGDGDAEPLLARLLLQEEAAARVARVAAGGGGGGSGGRRFRSHGAQLLARAIGRQARPPPVPYQNAFELPLLQTRGALSKALTHPPPLAGAACAQAAAQSG